MTKNKVLIIDDDVRLLALLEQYLTDYDLEIVTASTPIEGLRFFEQRGCDLVVLDIMMPGLDGFEVCRRLRKVSDVPVIMLTARGDTSDRIVGLELGADDYMPKPFEPRELVARIKAVLRRRAVSSGVSTEKSANPLIAGDLVVQLERRTVIRAGRQLELTGAEFELLTFLIKNKGIVLSRNRLLDVLSGRDYLPFDRSIDVHISRLRQKIEDDPKKPHYIKTVWGVGYVFTERSEDI
ncbi:response regulator [bacterium]|nr:response regulator [bacterium]